MLRQSLPALHGPQDIKPLASHSSCLYFGGNTHFSKFDCDWPRFSLSIFGKATAGGPPTYNKVPTRTKKKVFLGKRTADNNMSSPKTRREDSKGDVTSSEKEQKEKKKTKEAPKSARSQSDKAVSSLAEKKRKRLSASILPERRSSSGNGNSGRRGTTGTKPDVKRDSKKSLFSPSM